jgi:hypothetical protein
MSGVMRGLRLFVVFVACSGAVYLRSATAVEGACANLDPTIPSGCRQFSAEHDPSGIVVLQFIVSAFPSVEDAARYFEKTASEERKSSIVSEASTIYTFGESQVAFDSSLAPDSGAEVVFRVKDVVALWSALGAHIDGMQILHDVLLKAQAKSFGNDVTGRVMSLLPTAEDLPAKIPMEWETFSGGVTPPATATSVPDGKATPDYQATISVLQTQVAENNQGSKTPTVPATLPSSGPVLSLSGSGTHNTETFTASGDWDLAWSYDCSAFGMAGNFIVYVYEGDVLSFTNLPVNQLGTGGSGVEHYHSGGTYYLQIVSECSWKISVAD